MEEEEVYRRDAKAAKGRKVLLREIVDEAFDLVCESD